MTVWKNAGPMTDRAGRLRIMKQERQDRASGKWTAFRKIDIAAGQANAAPNSWMHDVHTVFNNGWCVVMVRTCKTEWGYVQHAAIRNATDSDFSWQERQRIKAACFGAIATAIEIFPAADRLIDEANLYHLWVLPLGFQLPFGIHSKEPCSTSHHRP